MASRTRRKNRRRGGGIYVLLAIILTLAAVAVGIGLFFRVENIEVSGNVVYKTDEIVKASGIDKGDNMLALDEKSMGARLEAKLTYIENVQIIKTYPASVMIKVEENAPVAYIKVGSKTWMLNTACKLFEAEKAADVKDLIKLTGAELSEPASGKIAVSSDGKNKMKFVAELLEAIRSNGMENKINEIDVENIGAITFDYDGRFEVNLGSDGEIGNKVTMLLGAIKKIDAGARGRLEFTSDIELHFMPES